MSKKEKYLYLVHGKRYDLIIKYYVTFSKTDTQNVLKCNEKMLEESDVIMSRTTKRFKFIRGFIYLNKYVGGKELC